MRAHRFCLLTIMLGGCASPLSQRGHVSVVQSAELVRRFEQLKPPFDSRTASGVLGEASWIDRAYFYHYTIVTGFLPLHSGVSPGTSFLVEFREATSSVEAGYSVCVHVNITLSPLLDDQSFQRFSREFFSGHSAASVQVDEYTIGYPDGHFINVLPHSRKIYPPNTYHL